MQAAPSSRLGVLKAHARGKLSVQFMVSSHSDEWEVYTQSKVHEDTDVLKRFVHTNKKILLSLTLWSF